MQTNDKSDYLTLWKECEPPKSKQVHGTLETAERKKSVVNDQKIQGHILFYWGHISCIYHAIILHCTVISTGTFVEVCHSKAMSRSRTS